MLRRRIIFEGRVQGVGFRWNTKDALAALAVTGYVQNLTDGSVELLIEGSSSEVNDAQGRVEKRMLGYWKSREWDDLSGDPHYQDFSIRY